MGKMLCTGSKGDVEKKHEPDSSAQPVKPALIDDKNKKKKKKKGKKGLTWDEHAIEEHNLLRGTRMKVRMNTDVIGIKINTHFSS